MAYFNHAFNKTFVGTNGFQTDSRIATSDLTVGQFAFFNPKTWQSFASAPTGCCPAVLVAGSIHPLDKIGKFHGGYAESVKSKTINPKYLHRFYKVLPCAPQQMQITIGTNYDNYEAGRPNFGLCNANSGTEVDKTFYCGENYDLRLDIKGSPALRFLTRNDYFTANAYTGCCPADSIAPTPVNPLLVYIQWAYMLLNSPLINPFILVNVTYSADLGVTWLEIGDGTSSTTNLALLLGYIQDPASIPGNATAEDTLAGLIVTGAYEDTRFGDCTFYPSDSIIAFLEPVKLYASEVDNTGDPCVFGGVCVYNTCQALQLKGTGENVIRDLILTEGYMQQPFYTGQDLRIREITNGTDVTDAIDRAGYYTRYYIQHSVPRFNNPTGTFDNEQYLLEIVGAPELSTLITSTVVYTALTNTSVFTVESTLGAYVGGGISFNGGNATTITAVSGTTITVTGDLSAFTIGDTVTFYDASLLAFEGFMEDWLENCNACEGLQTYDCPEYCIPVPPVGGGELG